MVPIWHGRIDADASVVLAEPERAERRRFLRTLIGENIELVIRKQRTQRSLDQNNYIHAVPILLLAEYFGYTIPEMKLVLMGECWGWKTIAGHEVPIKPSTSEMSVEECSYFIEWVIPWAMVNHHVAIPLPNEVAA